MPLYLILSIFFSTLSNHENTNIFKVPEVPKAAVPEKKVPEVIPPKPESPPPAGNNETVKTYIYKYIHTCICVLCIYVYMYFFKEHCFLSVVKMFL